MFYYQVRNDYKLRNLYVSNKRIGIGTKIVV